MRREHPTYAVLEDIDRNLGQFKDHPMLIVWGAKDFVFNDWFLGQWRERFPSAKVEYVEDAAHYVVEDAHERIVGWMRDFLNG